MNIQNNEEMLASKLSAAQEQGGDESRNDDEILADAATNPGSPDPTFRGSENDQMALAGDESLGAPDKNFFENENAGSDGEPGAGRLGGVDEQFREELERSGPSEEPPDPGNDSEIREFNSLETGDNTAEPADL